MNAGGGFFADALDVGDGRGEVARAIFEETSQRRREHFFFLVGRGEQGLASLDPRAPQSEHRGVAAIVKDQIAGLIGVGLGRPVENSDDIVPIFLERLALDREHRHARHGDRGGRVVLSRINVARCPADRRAKCRKRFDQNRSLNRHVQRTDDARALQGLRLAEFPTQCHQPRHFRFSNINLLAAKIGKVEILDMIVTGQRFCGGGHEFILQRERVAPPLAPRRFKSKYKEFFICDTSMEKTDAREGIEAR